MTDVATVLKLIAADAQNGDIVFPTHAQIALRVQRLLDDPDCPIDALTRLIGAEPVLATRMLTLANSTIYNPSGRRIDDIKTALTRIGFAGARAIAAVVVIKQMQNMSPLSTHRTLAAQLWKHTAHVAALARVLARRVTRQNPEAAFLAGIVHEIGNFYLIARAGEFPGLLERDLEILHGEGEAAIGRAVLAALDVPEEIGKALETLWTGYLAMPPRSLGDTLLLANHLAPIESPLDALTGISSRGIPAEIELLVNEETLTAVLAESGEEVNAMNSVLDG